MHPCARCHIGPQDVPSPRNWKTYATPVGELCLDCFLGTLPADALDDGMREEGTCAHFNRYVAGDR